MDQAYPCDKFGDSFSHFGFVVQTDRQTENRITDAAERLTHATTVGVSNNLRKFQFSKVLGKTQEKLEKNLGNSSTLSFRKHSVKIKTWEKSRPICNFVRNQRIYKMLRELTLEFS